MHVSANTHQNQSLPVGSFTEFTFANENKEQLALLCTGVQPTSFRVMPELRKFFQLVKIIGQGQDTGRPYQTETTCCTLGMPTLSCCPPRTAACTSPTASPNLGKTTSMAPAVSCTLEALCFLAKETARGVRLCPSKANARPSASYIPPEKRHASAPPSHTKPLFVLAPATCACVSEPPAFSCVTVGQELRQQSVGAFQTRSATSVPHCSSPQGFRFTLQHPPNCIPKLSELSAYFLRQAS